ncbi:hypothetical protein EC844_10650 [Acinetobacter calcoaceticus]|uniref:Uncharacterized protein n=1 Tax=Acinetobacter calcoaceticus TaxID=471 RepID=A0A4V2R1C4_ACICA|nr:hypothetical protein EC844_10650 [Acinetobacter calcoaceticus]
MQFLFNSKGQHVANLVNHQLHSPDGHNIGHLSVQEGVFIDLNGRYLGEIVLNNRLLYNSISPFKTSSFAVKGNYGNAGSFGNPGSFGSIGMLGGYQDIEAGWLSSSSSKTV